MARTSVYSDIDGALTKQTDGDIQKDTEIEAIKNSLTNIVSTFQGSRRMLQEFAAPVQGYLFEPIDEETARLISELLFDAIEFWDHRVEITGLEVEPLYDLNEYRFRMSFKVQGSTLEQEIDFILKAE